MILTTERLVLRPWQENDAESLYEYAKDERVGPIAGWPVHESQAQSLEYIQTVFAHDEVYALAKKQDNRAIGMVGQIACTLQSKQIHGLESIKVNKHQRY